MVQPKKTLIIIDSNSVIHRAFHALPPLATKKGEVVNAVYGFLLVFFKAIKEFQPDFVAACFDFPAPTFRHKKFKEYKAKRAPAPKELYNQIPIVKKVLKAFNVSVFEKKGFEADDIMGTIGKNFSKKQSFSKVKTIILSGDLDILQLVDENIKVYLLKKGVKNTVLYDREAVCERYEGLSPGQLVDFRALRGDASDNIPGVAGIGEKTAIALLKQFGTLENIYKEIAKNNEDLKIIKPKTREALISQREQAFLSKSLAEIKTDVLLDFSPIKCQWGDYDKSDVLKILSRLGFHTLVKRLPDLRKKDEREERRLKLW